MTLDKQNLIWIDLEMTGLDPEKERIIEIATIVTDKNLNILAEGPVLAIHQSDELLNKIADYFHYRHLDVSTLKELAARWKPEILDGFSKQNTHLALDDIRESIKELAYYREHFLKMD